MASSTRSPRKPNSKSMAKVDAEKTSSDFALPPSLVGAAKITLSVLKELMTGVPVPFVQGVAGTAVKIIEILENIQNNRDDCSEIQSQISYITEMILRSLAGKHEKDIDSDQMAQIVRLSSELEVILKGLESLPSGAKVVDHEENARRIKRYREGLQAACTRFHIESGIISPLQQSKHHRNVMEKLTEIGAAVSDMTKEQSKGNIFQKPVPSRLNPPCPKIFYGRQDYVNNVVGTILGNEPRHVAILGAGGMGKTSVALAVLHDQRVVDCYKQHRWFIPCDQAATPSLLLGLLTQQLQVEATHIPSNPLDDIMSALRGCSEKRLVILDNLETTWDHSGTQSEVEDILDHLGSVPYLTILVTMRGALAPSRVQWASMEEMQRLSLDAARKTFMDICSCRSDESLDKLLDALDCIPLAVTLMATVGRMGETPARLLESWQKERTQMLNVNAGDRLKSIDASIRLSLLATPIKDNSESVILLSIIAMLPSGARLENLQKLAPKISNTGKAWRALVRVSLAYNSNDTLQLLAPIRSYVPQNHPIAEEDLHHLYSFYFALARRGEICPDNREFIKIRKEFIRERTNADAILSHALNNSPSSESIVSILNYNAHFDWTSPRLGPVAAAMRIAIDLELGELMLCMKRMIGTLYAQFDYGTALPLSKLGCDFYLQTKANKDAAEWLLTHSEILRMLRRYSEAHLAVNKAESIYQNYRLLLNLGVQQWQKTRKRGLVQCLFRRASIYCNEPRLQEACGLYQKASEIFLREGDPAHQAECLYRLSLVHMEQGHWKDSKASLVQAWTIFLGLQHVSGLSECLSHGSRLAALINQRDVAERWISGARELHTQCGDRRGLAYCLVMESYLQSTSGAEGTGKLEEAIELFKEIGSKDEAGSFQDMMANLLAVAEVVPVTT